MRKYVDYCESRYSEEEEMIKSVSKNDWKDKIFQGAGMPIITDIDKGITYNASNDIHTMIIGGTGSKKTLCCVLPSVLSMIANGESVVITDPKREMYKHLIGYIREKNIKTNILDFRNPQEGDCWNPLLLPYRLYKNGNRDKAVELLKDIAKSLFSELSSNCKDVFWTNVSEEYFVGLALILFREGTENQITIEEVSNLDAYGSEKFGGSTYMKAYMDEIKEEEPLIVRNIYGTLMAPNETMASIKSVFSQPVNNIVCQENLNDMLSRSDFDVSDMGKEQVITFLIMPDEKTTYNALITMFLKQSYELLIDAAEKYYNGVLPIRVNWILEEAGNIPALSDFENMMTASRSRNIRFFLVFQSQQQIEKKYKGSSQLIIGNCDCIVFLNSKDMHLLKYISQLAGQYRSSYGQEKRPLISINQLQHLSKEKAECVIFLERHFPLLTYLPIIYDYGKYVPICNTEVAFKKRERVVREKFDIQGLVKRKKTERLKQMMNEVKLEENKGVEPVGMSNGAMTITVVTGMDLGQFDMEIFPTDLKSEIVDLVSKELGLEGKISNLKANANYRPILKNEREETCPADDSEIGDFVKDGEKLVIIVFGAAL